MFGLSLSKGSILDRTPKSDLRHGRKDAARNRRKLRFDWRVERLEDRALLSVDLTTPLSSGTINGAIFRQGATTPAGSGNIHSFVRIRNTGTEQGYNTDAARPYTDPVLRNGTGITRTFNRSLPLSAVPIVSIDGKLYREFVLDINQEISNPLLSLDRVQIFLGATGALQGYPDSLGTLVYDTGGGANWVELNASLSPGSGGADMFLDIPLGDFTGPNQFVYLYSHFGTQILNGANDGFEEWATPTLGAVASNTATTIYLGATGTTPLPSPVPAFSTVHDSATVRGTEGTPTGNVTFLFYNTIDGTGTPVGAGTVTLVNGVANPSDASDAEGPLNPGSYSFTAHYNGDTTHLPSDSPVEPFTVKASPVISTTASAGGVVDQVTLNDTAHLSGGFNPTGSILFTLTAPDGSTAYTQTVTVNGNADYSTSLGVPATQGGIYTWSAVYSGDGNNSGATASTVGESATVMQPIADLALSKMVNTTAPNVGDTITYTVTLNNNGPDPATGVQVIDLLPSGLQFVSATPSQGTYDQATGLWLVESVSTHAAQTLTITAKVISPAAETNSAAVTHSDQFDPNQANNGASATVTPQQADLAVFKSVSNPTPNVGTTITYTITLDNGGPDPAAGVVVSDILPAVVTYVSSSASQGAYDPTTNLWTVGDVNVATPQTLVITVTVVSAASTANTATIAKADQFDPDLGNNSATTSIDPNQADLGLVKSVDHPRPNVGDTVTFTVLLVNSGPSAATGVVVTDPLPAGLQFVSATPSEGTYDSTTGTWTVGGVAVGAPQTLTITATVISPAGVTNTAMITHADQPDPDTSNNSDSTSIDPKQADLALFKTVSDAHPKAGETVIFIVGLRNKGPNDATGVQVSDPLPSGLQLVAAHPSQGTYDPATGLWSVGAVSTNAAQALIITATVISPAAETNSAAVTRADQFDPDPANNGASATVTPQQADLAVFKSVSNPTTIVGGTVTFTVGLSNAGPNTATGVIVSDPLPAGLRLVSATPSQGTYDPVDGLWSLGTLATSQRATLTILAIVVSPAAETNTAAITHSDQFDLNTTNNTATSTVTPQLPAPTVTNLQRFGFHAQPTELVLTFDSPLDPVRAQDVNNYRLFELLHGGRLRQPIPIKTATYDSTLHTVTLTFERPPFLALQRHYGLIVDGTSPSGVAGSTGVSLDGRGNGVPGSDYFRVFGHEILAGPNRHTDPHGQAGVHRVHLRHGSRAVHVRLGAVRK